MRRFEEYGELPVRWVWIALILFSAAILTWGMLFNMLVEDRPRDWDFGQLPDTPSESVFSTTPHVEEETRPLQVEPLPQFPPEAPSASPVIVPPAPPAAPSQAENEGAGTK